LAARAAAVLGAAAAARARVAGCACVDAMMRMIVKMAAMSDVLDDLATCVPVCVCVCVRASVCVCLRAGESERGPERPTLWPAHESCLHTDMDCRARTHTHTYIHRRRTSRAYTLTWIAARVHTHTYIHRRFVVNVPTEELSSFERICFQIEQAYWFYEDFYREKEPSLPHYTLREFAAARTAPHAHRRAHADPRYVGARESVAVRASM
jgi:hypothetical protein